MEINQLRYFVAATQEQSFTKAAEKCFTTRQNVSRAIKGLEAELGCELFARKGNAMTLTSAGEAIVQQAQSILDSAESIKLLCNAPEHTQPHVKIAISHNLFSGAPATAASIVESHVITDQITEVSAKECYERVREGASDMAIITAMERSFPGCHAQKVSSSAAYLLVGESSRLAKRTHYSLADLKNIAFVLMPEPQFQYEPMFNLLGALGLDESQVSTVTSTGSMLHIIKRIEAAAVVTDTYFATTPKGTVAIPINDPRLNWCIYVLYKPKPETYPAIDRFIRDLKRGLR